MLYVNSSGGVFLRAGALRALAAPELHVVATAVDSGAPPRQVRRPPAGPQGPTLPTHFCFSNRMPPMMTMMIARPSEISQLIR